MQSHDADAEFFSARSHSPESPRAKDIRLPFERDRARLVHSAAFRRLQGKTQVMGVGEGDFHRTRLTHSLECAQLGVGLRDQLKRTKAIPGGLEKWFPCKALVEAACFAHDIGHPPFGHGGESALHIELWEAGGFEGNAQTLRVLTRLEKYKRPGWGINPTRRLILAVLKYPVPYSRFFSESVRDKPPKCYFDEEQEIVDWALTGFCESDRLHLAETDAKGKALHRSFDCSLMELADDIAYGVHDIEDIVARGLAVPDDFSTALKDAFDEVGGELVTNCGPLRAATLLRGLSSGSFERKQAIGTLVSAFCTAVKVVEVPEFEHPLLRFKVALPPAHHTVLTQLKTMAFRLVIRRAAVQQLERRGQRIVRDLFRAVLEDPEELIPRQAWEDGDATASRSRRVCDYVAGMTDSYAEKVYRRLFLPGFGSSGDEL